jgi:predicted ester cyclase
MNKIELVKSAFTFDDHDRLSDYSDDFQWTDELGSPPIDRSSWLSMDQLMKSAFPDLSYVIEGIREDGDGVVVTSHFSGTFSNDLDLSSLGMGVIPATGKAVVFPSQRDRVSFEGDKISELHNLETGPDAGMAGLAKALGADMG